MKLFATILVALLSVSAFGVVTKAEVLRALNPLFPMGGEVTFNGKTIENDDCAIKIHNQNDRFDIEGKVENEFFFFDLMPEDVELLSYRKDRNSIFVKVLKRRGLRVRFNQVWVMDLQLDRDQKVESVTLKNKRNTILDSFKHITCTFSSNY